MDATVITRYDSAKARIRHGEEYKDTTDVIIVDASVLVVGSDGSIVNSYTKEITLAVLHNTASSVFSDEEKIRLWLNPKDSIARFSGTTGSEIVTGHYPFLTTETESFNAVYRIRNNTLVVSKSSPFKEQEHFFWTFFYDMFGKFVFGFMLAMMVLRRREWWKDLLNYAREKHFPENVAKIITILAVLLIFTGLIFSTFKELKGQPYYWLNICIQICFALLNFVIFYFLLPVIEKSLEQKREKRRLKLH